MGFRHRLAPTALAAGLGLTAACGGSTPAEPVAMAGSTMGTTWAVRLAVPMDDESTAALRSRVEAELAAVDAAMSTWRPDSELSRFNAAETGEPVELSPDLFAVVEEAVRVGRETGGAFDVTVGPLVNALGFGPEPAADEPPDDEELAALRERTGLGLVELDAAARTVRKGHPRLYLDLSGIAKGHAVDRVAEALAGEGLADFMVEVGGEVRARGVNPDGLAWRIGVERPDAARGVVERILPLTDAAMATSGDYRNFRLVDGERLTHIVDPRSGRSVHHRLASATVVHDRCATADALATALIVLGPEEARAFAEREDLAVLLLLRGDEGFDEWISPALADRIDG